MMSYQGHLPDGSSVQRHSAGGAYPYACQLRDKPAGGYWYELIGPGIKTALRFNSSEEWDTAVRRLQAVRADEDAWAFENEQLQTYCGQKLEPMRFAAREMARQGMAHCWKQMTPGARVGALLTLGAVRNTLAFPVQLQPPSFAGFARRAL